MIWVALGLGMFSWSVYQAGDLWDSGLLAGIAMVCFVKASDIFNG